MNPSIDDVLSRYKLCLEMSSLKSKCSKNRGLLLRSPCEKGSGFGQVAQHVLGYLSFYFEPSKHKVTGLTTDLGIESCPAVIHLLGISRKLVGPLFGW